jgi:2-polyprenyl-3-methyl-5-hydroxy-6-metoxy-1,4-benzoquinol methylase
MQQQNHGRSMSVRGGSVKNPRSIRGFNSDRLSGLHDLLRRAEGMSVLDIATNHGLIAFEFARSGAALVHGCDSYEPAVDTARAVFSELPIPSRFEVVNLTHGPAAIEAAFGEQYLPRYDIVLFLGIYHLLKEQTSDAIIGELVQHLVGRVARYFAFRTGQGAEMGPMLEQGGLRRVHYSALSSVAGPVEIWQRG